ncbi:MAG: nitrilase-related carbon-nitrogen hydrolase [Enhygromyxa sp.]
MSPPGDELERPKAARGPSPWRALLVGLPPRLPHAKWIALAYTLCGALLGLAMVHPRFAVCAWLSVACMAAALTWTRSLLGAFGGALWAHSVTRIVGLNWVAGMNELIFDHTPVEAYAFLAAQSLVWALPLAVGIGLGFAAFRRRIAPCLWLPPAWGLGEVLRFDVLMNVNIGDWLITQWTFEPVLRTLGHLGWWPTHCACLFAAACVGQAVATRSRAVALPGLGVGAGLLLVPPLPNPGVELLEGVAAIHATSTVDLPHAQALDAGSEDPVELLVWPEAHLHLRPYLLEGEIHGVRLRRLVHRAEADHLIGLTTSFPHRGQQNQVVALDAEGRVLGNRAKKLLLPVAERRHFGVGDNRFVPGRAPALLELDGRAIIPLICGEFMSRELIAEGRREGGELLVVVARDQMMVNDRAKRQLLALQVMRSVEYGVPSIRASYGGWAYFISADGRVLARSGNTRSGLLRWDEQHGPRDVDFRGYDIADPPPPARPEIAVLFSREAPEYRARCPEGRCSYHALEDFRCPSRGAATVIVSGHGEPPSYLSHPAEQLAAAIRCFAPELIVIDTCFGASSELLAELADLDAVVVAAPFLLPSAGLNYGPAFFEEGSAIARARAVTSPHDAKLLRWRLDGEALAAAIAEVAELDAAALRDGLVRRDPPYVGVEVEPGATVLVPFAGARLSRLQGARRWSRAKRR